MAWADAMRVVPKRRRSKTRGQALCSMPEIYRDDTFHGTHKTYVVRRGIDASRRTTCAVETS